jgi:hypothetical protein
MILITIILTVIEEIFMVKERSKKRLRTVKVKNIALLCKYRRMMAFYHDFMGDFEWLNRDIESVLQGKFINDEDY